MNKWLLFLLLQSCAFTYTSQYEKVQEQHQHKTQSIFTKLITQIDPTDLETAYFFIADDHLYKNHASVDKHILFLKILIERMATNKEAYAEKTIIYERRKQATTNHDLKELCGLVDHALSSLESNLDSNFKSVISNFLRQFITILTSTQPFCQDYEDFTALNHNAIPVCMMEKYSQNMTQYCKEVIIHYLKKLYQVLQASEISAEVLPYKRDHMVRLVEQAKGSNPKRSAEFSCGSPEQQTAMKNFLDKLSDEELLKANYLFYSPFLPSEKTKSQLIKMLMSSPDKGSFVRKDRNELVNALANRLLEKHKHPTPLEINWQKQFAAFSNHLNSIIKDGKKSNGCCTIVDKHLLKATDRSKNLILELLHLGGNEVICQSASASKTNLPVSEVTFGNGVSDQEFDLDFLYSVIEQSPNYEDRIKEICETTNEEVQIDFLFSLLKAIQSLQMKEHELQKVSNQITQEKQQANTLQKQIADLKEENLLITKKIEAVKNHAQQCAQFSTKVPLLETPQSNPTMKSVKRKREKKEEEKTSENTTSLQEKIDNAIIEVTELRDEAKLLNYDNSRRSNKPVNIKNITPNANSLKKLRREIANLKRFISKKKRSDEKREESSEPVDSSQKSDE